ncbi:glutamyl-tRNA reductase [Christensenella sp. NSJ-35]|uniref:Glutamyl-tRNA reductase n=1 Tax=Christensenella tenuis TaxID=2763033 RepID=A0ABR7EHA9_9FIRM|nr:glutamyl-tRNA reductase [Christensenella tenuis]MBC5649185.1 glutamyl-tRNA reductase [Christensenella tenuis]
MNIVMAGIDYRTAGIEIREKFSFTKKKLEAAYARILKNKSISGCIILSTCNRTEIYLSCTRGYRCNAFSVLCSAAEACEQENRKYARIESEDIFSYLCKLSCGIKSQIWGEDQIISQVKDALSFARGCNATDAYLEVLFRLAVTGAKKIKTTVKFSGENYGVCDNATKLIDSSLRRSGKILVIGNGEIGKLMALSLMKSGYDVTMTLRSYKKGKAILPEGVKTVDYAKRYGVMERFDCVVSGTLSPHFTIEKEPFAQLLHKPKILVDLAVPRDIEKRIGEIQGISLFDIDMIGKDIILESHAGKQEEIDLIVKKYKDDFEKWISYKEKMVI